MFYACNYLIFIILQKVIFCYSKDDLLASKRCPFGMQKVMYCRTKNYILRLC